MPITSFSEGAGRNCSREGGEGSGNQAALPPPLQQELEEGEAWKKMAAVAAEAAATAASPGEGGAGEAEPEMEPIPGSEAGTDPLPVTATEASVPDGEADSQQSSPQADEPPLPPPPPPPGELARNPEAAGLELEAEEKLPARVVESAAAAPQEGPDLPPSPVPPPEQPPAPEERQDPPLPQPVAPALVPPAGGDSAVSQLIPGSEVRVTLDHIIEDALVVSFRYGEKLFSGVLMDLSKRYRTHPQHVSGRPPQSVRSPGRERPRAALSPRPAPASPARTALGSRVARSPKWGSARGPEGAVPGPGERLSGQVCHRVGAWVRDGLADVTPQPPAWPWFAHTGAGWGFLLNAKDFCRERGAGRGRLLVRHVRSPINL